MRRVISLYLPTWPTDRVRRMLGDSAPSPDVPLVLKGMEGRRQLIAALDGCAWQRGLRRGMAMAKAQALLSDLTIMDMDAAADQAALEALSRWALEQYSPIVAADPPDGLVLDISGAAHLYGGEQALVTHIIAALGDMGITAYAALSDTWGASYALVRFGRASTTLIEPGKTVDAVLKLPVSALRLPPQTIEGLRDLGFDDIGELASKPRAPLARRFGQQLWRQVDMMFGRVPELIVPIDCPGMITVKKVFHEPIGAAETIEKYIARLTAAICDRLEVAGFGAKRLDLRLTNADHSLQVISVTTAKPVRAYKALFRLLRDKIEQIMPGIDEMTLAAVQVEPLGSEQLGASFSAEEKPDIADLWDTISNRYGEGRLFRIASVATDIPERAVRRLPPLSKEQGSARNLRYRRPERLLPPERIGVPLAELPDNPPREFTWRDRRYRVVAAESPEVVRGEWWVSDNEKGKVRTYFVLEVESGQRFWVFRGGDGVHPSTGSLTWYMHGQMS